MQRYTRWVAPVISTLCVAVALTFVLRYETPEPADFTFSNGTEIKSLDPAIVTGQPEGRIIRALYEGLLDWDPQDSHPIPGVAQRWKASPDGLRYTFFLREDAVWSNGDPLVAADFVYSFRRFLDPMTAAEYSFLLYEVTNAEKYNRGLVEPGDKVEVERTEAARPADAPPFARPPVLRGVLVGWDDVTATGRVLAGMRPEGPTSEAAAGEDAAGEDAAAENGEGSEPPPTTRVYLVEIDGATRHYSSDPAALGSYVQDRQVEACQQVLLDFAEVGIRAVGERTLEIQLDNIVPYFTNLMGFYPLFPVHRQSLEAHGYPAWTRPENLVTNGPFVLESRRIRDRIRLRKNPRYWDRENVHLEIMDALAVDSLTTEMNLYETGQVDWISAAPTAVIPELLKRKRSDFKPVPTLTIYFYRVNVTRPGLDQKKVRQALSLALNRQEVVDTVTRAGQIPAYRFVPPGIPEYDAAKRRAGVVVEPKIDMPARLERARQLLAESGYGEGNAFPRIEILYNDNDLHGQIAELIQAQWKETLDIDVSLVRKEWQTYLSDQRQLNYFVSRAGWTGDYLDPNTFLDLFITGRSQNSTGWGNARYDELMARASEPTLNAEEQAEVEREVRAAANWTAEQHEDLLSEAILARMAKNRMDTFVEAEEILLDECAIIPVYYYVSQSLVRPYVKGFYRNLQDTHPYKGLRVDQDEKRRFWEQQRQ